VRLYTKVNPEKIPVIHRMMLRFRHDLPVLLATALAKYNVEASEVEDPAKEAPAGSDRANRPVGQDAYQVYLPYNVDGDGDGESDCEDWKNWSPFALYEDSPEKEETAQEGPECEEGQTPPAASDAAILGEEVADRWIPPPIRPRPKVTGTNTRAQSLMVSTAMFNMLDFQLQSSLTEQRRTLVDKMVKANEAIEKAQEDADSDEEHANKAQSSTLQKQIDDVDRQLLDIAEQRAATRKQRAAAKAKLATPEGRVTGTAEERAALKATELKEKMLDQDVHDQRYLADIKSGVPHSQA